LRRSPPPNRRDPRRDVVRPQRLARIGGVLYLIIIAAGLFGELFVRGKLIVPGDATATDANIRSSELLWRAGIAGNLFHLACAVALMVILYVLFRPVIAALFPLGNAKYLKAFDPEQLHALANLSIRTHTFGFGVSLIFFGCTCLVLGYLIHRSGYFPGVLGVLMQIAGLCYLVNSFALVLSPGLADRLFPAILIPPFIGETSFCLWLLVKGVNIEKWKARVSGE
jgi:hypothetical protein